MPFLRDFILLIFFLCQCTAARKPTSACPILGSVFPAPESLRKNAIFRRATRMLDKELDALTWSNDTAFEAAKINDSFSIGIFNTEDDHLLHEYHFTGESVASGAQGVRKVDANSVYRIGSVSKLLTAYVFLISEGDSHWNQPITRYIPELAKVVNQTKQSANGILPCWEHITIVDLATHLAGLTNIRMMLCISCCKILAYK